MEVSHTPVDKPVVAREPVDQSGPQGGRADTVVYCWSYARRPLPEICESNVSEIAAEGLRRTAQPYAIEADIRGSPSERRLPERQKRSAPRLRWTRY